MMLAGLLEALPVVAGVLGQLLAVLAGGAADHGGHAADDGHVADEPGQGQVDAAGRVVHAEPVQDEQAGHPSPQCRAATAAASASQHAAALTRLPPSARSPTAWA